MLTGRLAEIHDRVYTIGDRTGELLEAIDMGDMDDIEGYTEMRHLALEYLELCTEAWALGVTGEDPLETLTGKHLGNGTLQ